MKTTIETRDEMTTKDYLRKLELNYVVGMEIMKRKNADYAGSDNPFRNFNNVEVLGVCSTEAGIIVRMIDKLSRISNLIKQDAQVKDESISDTLTDLMNYANILKVYLNAKNKD
jgi:hypothetical protein